MEGPLGPQAFSGEKLLISGTSPSGQGTGSRGQPLLAEFRVGWVLSWLNFELAEFWSRLHRGLNYELAEYFSG